MPEQKRRCAYRRCRKGAGGRKGIIGPDRKATAKYCDDECKRLQWELKHPDRGVKRGGRSKASYDGKGSRRRPVGTRPPTRYGMWFVEDDGRLRYCGIRTANKREHALATMPDEDRDRYRAVPVSQLPDPLTSTS